MNKWKRLFKTIRDDYGKYISYCVSRFCADPKYTLDIIYQAGDIEQMIYIQIWKYIGRYDKNKSSLKTYTINIMQSICNRCVYFSSMQKRRPSRAVSLNKEYINSEEGIITLGDTLIDKSLSSIDDNLGDFFYKKVLRETHQRIYDLVKQGYTYREIGKKFHVSRQRIGQIVQSIGVDIRCYEKKNNYFK